MYNVFSDNASLPRLLRSRTFILCMIALFAVALWISYTICGAKVIAINDGSTTKQIFTHYSEPKKIVEQAALSLNSGDELDIAFTSERSGSLTIHRAFDVTVRVGVQETVVRMTEDDTVAQAIAAAGFTTDGDDIFALSPQTALAGISEVHVDTVDYVTYSTTETIDYETIRTETTKLKKGQTEVKTEGASGTTVYHYQDKLINGEVMETTLLDTEVLSDVVHEEVLVGTASTANKTSGTKTADKSVTKASSSNWVSSLSPSSTIELDAEGRPVYYKQLITGKATAYTSSEGSLTATGRTVRTGLVAVNPKQIPYGSELYIRTPDGSIIYGYAIAADTGGFASKGRITADLFFNTKEECYQFGVRNIEIYVLS